MSSMHILGPLNISQERLIKAPRKSDELQAIYKGRDVRRGTVKAGSTMNFSVLKKQAIRSSSPNLELRKSSSSPLTPKRRQHLETKMKTPPLINPIKVSHSEGLSQADDLNEADITSMREGGSSGNIQEEKERIMSKEKFYIHTTAKESVESMPALE